MLLSFLALWLLSDSANGEKLGYLFLQLSLCWLAKGYMGSSNVRVPLSQPSQHCSLCPHIQEPSPFFTPSDGGNSTVSLLTPGYYALSCGFLYHARTFVSSPVIKFSLHDPIWTCHLGLAETLTQGVFKQQILKLNGRSNKRSNWT